MNDSIIKLLEEYKLKNIVPMHMPGHKRNADMLGDNLPWDLDVTEVEPFDDLYHPCGAIKTLNEKVLSLFGGEFVHLLVNGSTAGILSAIYALDKKKEKIIVARNCHQSVFHAIEICGFMPVIIEPEFITALGIYGGILPETVVSAVEEDSNVAGVILTSPTYEGFLSDIRKIKTYLEAYNIPLIVDEAHGAHLGFDKYFPESAVRLGADCVIQSLHKTLPALTQTAVLYLNSDLISREKIARTIRMFQTSSPSYVLMSSVEVCVNVLEEKGIEYFGLFSERLKSFYKKTKALDNLYIYHRSMESLEDNENRAQENELRENRAQENSEEKSHDKGMFEHDPSKIVIFAKDGGETRITGADISNMLIKRGVQVEMSGANYSVLMTSICNSDEDFARLVDAIIDIDKECASVNGKFVEAAPLASMCFAMTPQKAINSRAVDIEVTKSIGKVAAEYVWAYPPGIPWIIPGQRLTKDVIASISKARGKGIELRSTYSDVTKRIKVVHKN